MNFDIEFLLLEWAYRVDTGMPNVKNPDHINELRTILKETKYPAHFISEFIVNIIREDDIVKNKKSGNTYTVTSHNPKTQDLVTKDASEDELDKVKDKDNDEEKDDDDDSTEKKDVNIFDTEPEDDKDDDEESKPDTGLSDKENQLIDSLLQKYDGENIVDALGNQSKEHKNIAKAFMADLKALVENPSKQKAKELVLKFKLTVNKHTSDKPLKLYINTLGTDRKLISGGSKGAGNKTSTAIANLIRSQNVDLKSDTNSTLARKTFTPDRVYDNETDLKIESTDDTLTVGEVTLKQYNAKDLKSKLENAYKKDGVSKSVYAPKIEKALLKVDKHNFIYSNIQKIVGNSGELPVKDVNPGADLTTEEGRMTTSKVALDQLSAKIDVKVNSKQSKQISKQIKELDNYSGLEFNKKSNELLWQIGRDEELKLNSADITEIFAYVQELKNGRVAYMPADSTFKLGDLLVLPSSQPTVSDIINGRNDLDQMLITVENQSIKKDVGGASSSALKIDLSEFNHKDTQSDLAKITDSFKTIFSDESASVDSLISETQEKYKDILDNDAVYKIRLEGGKLNGRNVISMDDKIGNINKRLKNANYKQHERYYKLGLMMESIYNHEVKLQGFTNKKYVNNAKGIKVDKSNGTDNIAYLKFEYDVGFTGQGKPGNTFPTRFIHLH